jgi:dihydrolipoamide dehydrogenase
VAAANALGGAEKVRQERLPRSVNTEPELAAVGLTEQEATERGLQVGVGFADLAANPRAITLDRAAGALKLVVDTEFGEILGAHMVGVGATEVIAQVALAMHLEAEYWQLARVAHVHPTLAELVGEAAASV